MRLPKIGDVISSPVFENLIMCRDEYFNFVYNKNDLKHHKANPRFVVNPPSEYIDGELENNSKYSIKIDKNTKFVVIQAIEESGGSGGGIYQEDYSSVYTITAKELNKNGKWKEDGILIQFDGEGSDTDQSVKTKDIKFLGEMKMKFV